MLSPLESEIQWPAFLDMLGDIVRPHHDGHGQQRWYQFLKGYTLCQIGDWDGGEIEFAELRRADLPPHILWLPRTYFLNTKGGRTTVQGTMREYGGRFYLEVPEFHQTFFTEKKDRWNAPGLIDHANILFCFAGPRAVHDS